MPFRFLDWISLQLLFRFSAAVAGSRGGVRDLDVWGRGEPHQFAKIEKRDLREKTPLRIPKERGDIYK